MLNINDYISALCQKYGTYIYNNINLNDYINNLCEIYGTYIFHPIEES